MREDEQQTNLVQEKPPRGLFLRVMRRLGLERQLDAIKKNLELSIAILLVFLVFSSLAFLGLKQVLARSNFGPFLSLIFSDPGIVFKYRSNFAFSVFESIPGANFAIFLIPLAFLLLFIKLAVTYFDKLLAIIKSIKRQKKP